VANRRFKEDVKFSIPVTLTPKDLKYTEDVIVESLTESNGYWEALEKFQLTVFDLIAKDKEFVEKIKKIIINNILEDINDTNTFFTETERKRILKKIKSKLTEEQLVDLVLKSLI